MKKLGMILLLFLMVSLSLFSETKEEIAFNERLEKTRYPVELDFKGTPLSEVLAIISKMSGITIVADVNTVKLPIDLYLPRGQNLKKILDTIKTTNGLTSRLINDTMVLSKPSSSYACTSMVGASYVTQKVVTQSARNQIEFNIDGFGPIEENKFHNSLQESLSTFSIDVDKASYSVVRNAIKNGIFPNKDMVRVEEMINYFKYDYPDTDDKLPFSVSSEVGECDWNSKHKLAFIQLKGKSINEKELPKSNLVFLIDVSGSMNSYDKLPLVKESLKLLAENMKDDDIVSIVIYASKEGVELSATKGKDRKKIIEVLDRLNSGGSTAGRAGIQTAYSIAEENFIKGGNNRVILCTDGDFNVGISDTESMIELVKEKKKSGIALTIVGVGTDNLEDNRMEQMADKGDGNYFYLDSIREGKKIFVEELRGNLFTIAKDVKIQVEFNPAKVREYKLIGYENRVMKNEDFKDDKKDAGELGIGDTVTAIYELVMEDKKNEIKNNLKYTERKIKNEAYSSDEIMTVKLRYKDSESMESKEMEKVIKYSDKNKNENSKEFKFASAVAEFGLLVRDSDFREDASYENIEKLAREGKGEDYYGYRAEFIQMVETCKLLDKRDLKKLNREKRIMKKVIEKNLIFNNIKLSEVAEILTKVMEIKIIPYEEAKNNKINLSIPENKSVKEILEILKKEIGYLYEEENGAYTISNIPVVVELESERKVYISGYKVVGKVTEADGVTGIPGVTLSLGDDVNTLVLSDIGGTFIINAANIGTYILKATKRDYKPSGEIVEVKPNSVIQVIIKLDKLK